MEKLKEFKYTNMIVEEISKRINEDSLLKTDDWKYDLISNSYKKEDEDYIIAYIEELLKNNLWARKELAWDSYRLISNKKMRQKVAQQWIFTFWPKVI